MGKDNIIGKSLIIGAIEGLVISGLESFGGAVKEHGAEYLKSKLFGFGTNDEHLFLSACTYALKEKMITSDELIKVCQAIDECDNSKVRMVIGKEETEVITETPKLDSDGNIVTEKKTGKSVMVKTTSKANVKGAQMLGMFGKLTTDEIKAILNTSGATDSFMSDLKKKAAAATTAVQNSQIKRDGDNFFTKETWLDRVARELRQRNNTI